MKPRFIYILMTIIVMGMVIPAFAGSPEKKPGDNTKKENPVASPLSPLTTWNLYIRVSDPDDTCYAFTHCSLEFYIEAQTDDCVGSQSGYGPWHQAITWGYSGYGPIAIPTEVPCVKIKIINTTNTLECKNAPLNQSTCCACQSTNTCTMRICP
jgi:hypothetical protein